MQRFIGFEENALEYNRGYEIADDMPAIRHVAGALVSAVRPTVEGNLLEELAGGVFDASGALHPGCLQPRSEGRNAVAQIQARPNVEGSPNRLKHAVFGGVAFDHFGHFLLETTARLWSLPDFRDRPWLFLTGGRAELPSYQRAFLELLGLAPSQIVAVPDWIEVEDLVVPEPAFTYHHHIRRIYAQPFRQADVPAGRHAGRKIFLSRGDTTIARTLGERELEEVLRRDGWDIVVPERLPAAEQAALFRDDSVVMGLQGSAMHLGLFGKPGRRVVHLCRGQGYRGYYVLDDLVQADGTYLYAMRSHALASKPITGPFLLDFDQTIGFLRAEKLISPRSANLRGLPPATVASLEQDYAAWWHYTESQIRFHRQLDDSGAVVEQRSALDSAIEAVAIRPDQPIILCHALALTMKFDGVAAAAALLRRHVGEDLHGAGIDSADLLYFVSMIAESEGRSEAAIDAARRCVERAPTHPTYVNQLATVLFRRDMAAEARHVLLRLDESGHAVADNWFLLSLVCTRSGDSAAAAEWALKASRESRTNEAMLLNAGDCLCAEGRFDEARALYLRGIERSADAGSVLRRLAALERRMGMPDEAREHLLEAYRKAPSDEALRRECADALIASGRLPDLATLGRITTPAEGEQAVLLYKQSRSLNNADLIGRALFAAIRAVELAPRNPTILQMLFSLMLKAGRSAEAHLFASSLIGMGQATGSIHYVVSLAEIELGRRADAAEQARLAAELEPANDLIREHFERLSAS